MTDSPESPTPTPTPVPSVVLDRNATVKRSHAVAIVGVVVAVGLVAFTVIWFATRDTSPYQPGPAAIAFVDGFVGGGEPVKLSDRELKCVDDSFDGFDVERLDDDFDPMDILVNDEETKERTGRTLDECIDRASRVDLLAASLALDETAEGEAAVCLAEVFDDAVVAADGYEKMFAEEEAMSGILLGLFESFTDCGVPLFDPGFEPEFDGSDTDFAGCDTDLDLISMALQDYYSEFGSNAQSWPDLYPDFVPVDLSDRFTLEPGDDEGSVESNGINECEGYRVSYSA